MNKDFRFKRDHHNRILTVLQALDGALLENAKCYFGGGTAISLALDEYRESVDIDLICASPAGMRLLKDAVWQGGVPGLFREGAAIAAMRDLRSDHYGMRTALNVDGCTVKFEIIWEPRVDLAGSIHAGYGIPVLDRCDMYVEKLLANNDRWRDTAVLSRDIIDLSMMMLRWGPIPHQAWIKADLAYGPQVRHNFACAIDHIRQPEVLEACMTKMDMLPSLAPDIWDLHGGPKQRRPSPFDD